MEAKHSEIEITDANGNRILSWLFTPPSGKGPGVCLIHDVGGLRPEYDDMVQPFVEHGYTVLVPDMFHGIEPVIDTDEDGNPRKHWRGQSNDEAGMVILDAGVHALREMPGTGDRVSVTGFCFGGTLSYLAAVRRDDIAAASGYYATNAHQYLDEARNMRCPLILHISETDRTHTPEDAVLVRSTLQDVALAECIVHPGTVHGFANNEHPGYDEEVTRLANARTFELFDRAMGTATAADD